MYEGYTGRSQARPRSVSEWLSSIELEKYLPCFELHEVTVDVLPMLTYQVLSLLVRVFKCPLSLDATDELML